MTQGRQENFVVHAAVAGVGKFEQDTAALGRALEGVYAKIRESLASNLGADQIARLREEAAGLAASIAAQKREMASTTATKALTKAKEDPTEANVTAAKRADVAAQGAEKALRNATADLAAKRRKRIDEEAKVEHEADRLLLEGARTIRQRATEVVRNAASSLRGAKTTDIDAELRRTEAQQKRDAEKAIKDKAKADKEAAEKAERERNALSPQRIEELTARATPRESYDVSSAGRLSTKQAQQEIALAQADQALLAAKQKALSGAVPEAEMELELRALAEARLRADQSLYQTQKQLMEAQKEQADAKRNTAISENASPLGRAKSNFMIGFRGTSDVPYMQQAGQAMKFSLLYGTAYKALFAVTQTFQMALQEGVAFQQGLSDMAISTGRPKEELKQLAERLAATAASAGASPSAGVEIGARAMGLYGVTGPNKSIQEQSYVAELSTRIVSKMAMGSKVDPVTLQQNIAAVTQALGLGAGGQIRVADLDTYFTKRFGGPAGGTLEAGAQSSSVGIAAGFSLEQIQAMAALMIGRTGQTPSAVGGYLAQIFSRGGEGSLQNVSNKYGINTQQSLAGQFSDLSSLYNKAAPDQQSEISAAFGRGKVQNAVVAALQSWGEVADAASKAEAGAAEGSLDAAFTERLGNIGGQLNTLTGDVKEFAHLFGESGLLSMLGAGIEAFDQLVKGLNDILSLYNDFNPALRTAIAGLLTLALVGKVKAAGGLAGVAEGVPLLGRFARGAGAGEEALAAERAAAGAAGAAGEAARVGRAAGAMRNLTTGAAAVGRLGAAAVETIGPMGLAVGGLLALAEYHKSAKELQAAQDMATQAIKQTPNALASSGDLRNYASTQVDQARELAKTGNPIKQFLYGEDLDAQAKRMRADADRLKDAADALDRVPEKASPLIRRLDADSIGQGMDKITNSGGLTSQKLHALAKAIDAVGYAATHHVQPKINTDTLAGPLAASALRLGGVKLDPRNIGGVSGFLKNGLHVGPFRLGAKGYATEQGDNPDLVSGNQYQTEVEKQLGGATVRDRLAKAMDDRGLKTYDQLNKTNIADISKEVGKLTQTDAMGSVQNYTKLQKEVDKQIADALIAQRKIVMNQPQVSGRLNQSETTAFANSVQEAMGNRIDTRLDVDFDGKIRAARQAQIKLRKALRLSDDPDNPALHKALKAARTELATAEIDQIEGLRKSAEAYATTDKQKRAIARPYVLKEINSAVKSRNADVLARVISGAGTDAVALARKAVLEAKAIAESKGRLDVMYGKAAKVIGAAGTEMLNLVNSVSTPDAQEIVPGFEFSPKDKKKKQRPKVGVFDQMLKALDTTPSDRGYDSAADKESRAQIEAARIGAMAQKDGGDIAAARASLAQAKADLNDADKGSVEYYNALGAVYAAQRELTKAVGGVGAAKMAAWAARVGGEIAPARAAIAQAKFDLSQTSKGTVEYYQALASLFEARNQLSEALAAYSRNVRSLHIDATDPVATARLDLQEARRKLRRDAGKAKDVKAEDRVGIRDARNALESAAFEQRLSDVQVADQLGRISHSAYLRYLQNEHNRLSAISKRTRQQQDELNQIDQLMLDAKKEMSGAFNIGDIKLPTPYEVRKYVKEQAGLATTDKRYTQTTTTVYVNGADVGMVKRVISETVGKSARVMTTSPRRN